MTAQNCKKNIIKTYFYPRKGKENYHTKTIYIVYIHQIGWNQTPYPLLHVHLLCEWSQYIFFILSFFWGGSWGTSKGGMYCIIISWENLKTNVCICIKNLWLVVPLMRKCLFTNQGKIIIFPLVGSYIMKISIGSLNKFSWILILNKNIKFLNQPKIFMMMWLSTNEMAINCFLMIYCWFQLFF